MHKEITFQLTMSLAKDMYEKELITKEEYYAFRQKMIEKYTPALGTLFSELT